MQPVYRKHSRDNEDCEPSLKRSPVQRPEFTQDPFVVAHGHFQAFAARWAVDSQLLQLIASTSQNRDFPSRFQQYCINRRAEVADITVLKHMIGWVKNALQSNPNLQISSEHLEGAMGVMFSDYVVEELTWLRKNAAAYLRALLVETMVTSQNALWMQVSLTVIGEFQRLPDNSTAHNLFLSSLAANGCPEAIVDVFRFLLQMPLSTERTLLINEVVEKIRSLHPPTSPSVVTEQFEAMDLN
jgi:hypothetical protein